MRDSANALIDIGANLTSSRFGADLDRVLERAREAGVARILITGTSESGSTEALALARQYPGFLSSTAGVHPHDAKHWRTESAGFLARLAESPEVVAMGECGLDYNRDFSPRDQQRACFEAQLSLAAELNKPVFLHQRDAHRDFMALLEKYRQRLPGAVVHCFTGTGEELDDYLKLGCHIGVTGWLCDRKRGALLRELVRAIPLDRLMIESDAPYLTPHNLDVKPKGNRNEPGFLSAVLAMLAEVTGCSETQLAEHTSANARRFFGLPDLAPEEL